MILHDPIHGEVEITDQVVIDLVNSSALQRLKSIDQYGYRPLWEKPEVKIGPLDSTRYVHSVGVYLLLRRFGASLNEQIAGLIHDVSHAAFSHCADYIFGSDHEKRQHFQDSIFQSFVARSDIPEILKRYGVALEEILDDARFPLKERPLPDLCADRIAYCLQDALNFEKIDPPRARAFLDALATRDGTWYFISYDSARAFAELFSMMNQTYWAAPSAAVMLKTVGEALRHSMNRGYIRENDLHTTDKEVLEKMFAAADSDEILGKLVDRMNNAYSFSVNPDHYDLHAFTKSRAIDPFCLHRDSLMRVSDVDPAWGEITARALKPAEHFIQFSVHV